MLLDSMEEKFKFLEGNGVGLDWKVEEKMLKGVDGVLAVRSKVMVGKVGEEVFGK